MTGFHAAELSTVNPCAQQAGLLLRDILYRTQTHRRYFVTSYPETMGALTCATLYDDRNRIAHRNIAEKCSELGP